MSTPNDQHRFEAVRELGENFEALSKAPRGSRGLRLSMIVAVLWAGLGFAGGLSVASLTDGSRPIDSVPAAERLEVEQSTCGQGKEARDCVVISPSEKARDADPDVTAADVLQGEGGGIPIEVLGEICEAIPEGERASSPTCQSAGYQLPDRGGGR